MQAKGQRCFERLAQDKPHSPRPIAKKYMMLEAEKKRLELSRILNDRHLTYQPPSPRCGEKLPALDPLACSVFPSFKGRTVTVKPNIFIENEKLPTRKELNKLRIYSRRFRSPRRLCEPFTSGPRADA